MRKRSSTSAGGCEVSTRWYSTSPSRSDDAVALDEAVELGQVGLAHVAGVGEQLAVVLHRLEDGRALERQRQLVLVEQVEDDDVVLARAQPAQQVAHVVVAAEQIAEEHDERAPLHHLRQIGEGARQVGAPFGLDAVERGEQIVEVPRARARRQIAAQPLAEGDHAHLILLLQQ